MPSFSFWLSGDRTSSTLTDDVACDAIRQPADAAQNHCPPSLAEVCTHAVLAHAFSRMPTGSRILGFDIWIYTACTVYGFRCPWASKDGIPLDFPQRLYRVRDDTCAVILKVHWLDLKVINQEAGLVGLEVDDLGAQFCSTPSDSTLRNDLNHSNEHTQPSPRKGCCLLDIERYSNEAHGKGKGRGNLYLSWLPRYRS